MTEKEKRTILDMRAAGKQYKEIRLGGGEPFPFWADFISELYPLHPCGIIQT